MQRDDDAPDHDRSLTDRRFDTLVAALHHDDPTFVRRVTPRAAARTGVADLAVVLGLVATVLLGAVPLGLGLQLGASGVLVAAGVACVVLPVLVPLLVVGVLGRVRPGWR